MDDARGEEPEGHSNLTLGCRREYPAYRKPLRSYGSDGGSNDYRLGLRKIDHILPILQPQDALQGLHALIAFNELVVVVAHDFKELCLCLTFVAIESNK